MDCGQDGADKGNDPGKLRTGLAVSRSALARVTRQTYDANGDGSQRKGVADDAPDAKGRRPLTVAVVHVARAGESGERGDSARRGPRSVSAGGWACGGVLHERKLERGRSDGGRRR